MRGREVSLETGMASMQTLHERGRLEVYKRKEGGVIDTSAHLGKWRSFLLWEKPISDLPSVKWGTGLGTLQTSLWRQHSVTLVCGSGRVWVRVAGRGNGNSKEETRRGESKRAVLLSKMLPTPGLGARAKGPRVLFRRRPRERSSGPYPGCSPRTLRTCHCPGVWTGGWSASWWCCRSQKTPCGGERGEGQRVSLRAP